ncbi:MAG TPA: glycosyltransferase family 4 protein [Candidatus Baltobacteraceae bacterium]|nr:glycosyltransferase family 4 protein [Candidatus Baltobacteraceae bacterium]
MTARKVAHLTSVHIPSDTRIVYRECASLADAGYEVVLIATQGEVRLPRGVRMRAVRAPRNRAERMTRTVYDIYRAALAERADVYHFHDPELMIVGLLLRLHGARVVFDVHEDIPQDVADKGWIAPPLRPFVATACALALRALQRWYTAIVTATPAIAQRFPHRRTVVVHNYPRVDELAEQQEADFAKRARAVIYLGEITELRCIREMVASLDRPCIADDVRLHLAGRFETPALEQRVRSMPAWRKVQFSGYCQRDRKAAALSAVRAGLLLFRPAGNHDDALPNKLFEYLGAGLPVIMSNTLRCSSVVREHECGIVVDPSDPQQIAAAISTLVEDPARAQAMGERGRALVRERFLWTSEAAKLTKLYAEIA